MEKHELTHIETRVKELCQTLANLADDKDFQEFLRIIRRPGHTTPAEILFTGGLVDGMAGQAKILGELKQVLLTGSRAVTIK
jgi:hypothetical protein